MGFATASFASISSAIAQQFTSETIDISHLTDGPRRARLSVIFSISYLIFTLAADKISFQQICGKAQYRFGLSHNRRLPMPRLPIHET